ncbi:NAD(P)/FAD-dependent oxidoreductase [Oleiagrimonas soli]|uniref:FAD-dependent oxidoreductase n=1 Tax=Oleiagrimonas soli TaxID=1543381 RepID=A0A099CYW1_9GAMM|nr:FAD-binding oxidoreductase [Oleiagrimonas soli]KGI78215.1 FAD-dependent oxidoreductase [Oleiagrimonas soli]MBB6183323.1 gamma-glutamylputrescine oxidase [Oleiagrimonas soli]
MSEDASLSYYRATTANAPPRAPLRGRRSARVVIIGGGFAGLNTALGLAERGVQDVCLLEAERIGFGASGRNGGFVFAGYSLGERSLLDQLGADAAKTLFLRTVDAVRRIRRRISVYDIDCDVTDAGVLWANWFSDPGVLLERQRLLAKHFDTEWSWVPQAVLREQLHTRRYTDALFERNALHLHPLKYAQGLAKAATDKGVNLFEHSRAQSLVRDGSGWIVRTAEGEVQAEQVVLACGGYLAGLHARVDRAVLPIATYVMVTEPLGARLHETIATQSAVYDTRFAFDYYRKLPQDRLLWGGRISVRNRSAEAVKKLLRRDLTRVYPQLAHARIDFAWSGLMSYARHEMPQIGGDGQGLWWAQAFGGHGLAPTCVAGELLAAAMAGDDRDWQTFQRYGLVSAWRPLGYLAAQGSYWWLQLRDAWKDLRERR